MQYFQNCKDLNEVKATFKILAKQFHPDLSGFDSTAKMQEINKEYSFVCAKMAKGGNFTQAETEATILEAEAYREALEKVIGLQGINIELVGYWIWATGNTYFVREQLKAAGFIWAKKKEDRSAYFFRSIEFKAPNKGSKKSLDDIRAKYGSQQIATNYRPSFQLA